MKEWVEINLPYSSANHSNSFIHTNEHRVGVLIELDNGERLLIGDIDSSYNDGGCGCCSGPMFEDRIVKRYKVVLTEEELKALYNE